MIGKLNGMTSLAKCRKPEVGLELMGAKIIWQKHQGA